MARTIGIIGSGIGALAAGIRLLSQGYQVTIFEARKFAGGKAAGIDVEGHHLDSGPTILRMPQLLLDVFAAAGIHSGEIVPSRILSPHYRIYRKPESFLEVTTNLNQNVENISRFSSADANQYRSFNQRTLEIYRENLNPTPIETEKRKRFFQFRPKDVLPIQPSVFQETQRFFQNQFIQQAFSFYPLLFGRNPFSARYNSLMLRAIEQQWDILYVDGGFYQIIRQLLDVFQQMGGKLYTETQVEKIEVTRNQANLLRLKSGKQLHFDYLISNISPYQTQQMLSSSKKTDKVISTRQSTSYFMLHLLHVGDLQIPPHTILTTRNYGASMQEVFNLNKLPTDPWLYLYSQRPFDDGLNPLMIMTPVPNLGSPIEWGQTALTFRDRIIEKMNRYFPNFDQMIHYEKLSTPETLQQEYNLPGGSPLFPTIRRSVQNLFYVGDNTWSGLGLISTLSSAEQVAKTIITENA